MAADKLKHAAPEHSFIRVKTKRRGCSGLEYEIEPAHKQEEGEEIHTIEGAVIASNNFRNQVFDTDFLTLICAWLRNRLCPFSHCFPVHIQKQAGKGHVWLWQEFPFVKIKCLETGRHGNRGRIYYYLIDTLL